MGPWPLFCEYTLPILETKYSIGFIEVGPQNLLSKMHFNFAVMESRNHKVTKSWNEGINESWNDGRTWQIQYSPTLKKWGYNNSREHF